MTERIWYLNGKEDIITDGYHCSSECRWLHEDAEKCANWDDPLDSTEQGFLRCAGCLAELGVLE